MKGMLNAFAIALAVLKLPIPGQELRKLQDSVGERLCEAGGAVTASPGTDLKRAKALIDYGIELRHGVGMAVRCRTMHQGRVSRSKWSLNKRHDQVSRRQGTGKPIA